MSEQKTLKALAQWRAELAERKTATDAARLALHQTPEGEAYALQQERQRQAEIEVKQLEEKLRTIALANYEADKIKKREGCTVGLTTVYEYDTDAAIALCLDEGWHNALKTTLLKTEFKKYAVAHKPDIVTVQKVAKVSIASDLSSYV